MVDFVTRIVGWKTDARYNALSFEVNRNWDRSGGRGAFEDSSSATDLRTAVATDPKLNQADGLHPTAEGVDVIVKNILPSVEAFLGTISGQHS